MQEARHLTSKTCLTSLHEEKMDTTLVGFADDLTRLFPNLDGYSESAQQAVVESDLKLDTNRTSGMWM